MSSDKLDELLDLLDDFEDSVSEALLRTLK